MSKNDKKRRKFQAQDSVLKESINASQARKIMTFHLKFYLIKGPRGGVAIVTKSLLQLSFLIAKQKECKEIFSSLSFI